MNNQTVMNNIFSLCKGLFNQPAHIFNADESGVDLNSKAGKVIIHTKLKHAYSEQKNSEIINYIGMLFGFRINVVATDYL